MSDRKRSRSRDRRRSRSRSPSRKHRKEKKHRRHRSRSSSNVHLNPLFAAGPSYNQEQEVIQLRNELYMSQTRSTALEGETNRLRIEVISLKEELNRMKVLSEQKIGHSQLKTSNIEKTNAQLRAQFNAQGLELQKLREKVKFHDIQQAANKERVVAIEQRNQAVVAKCEELSARSRNLQLEKDQAEYATCVVQQQLDDLKQVVQEKDNALSNLQSHLSDAKDREIKIFEDNLEIEKKSKEKDLCIAAERRKFAQEKRKDQEMITALEAKLKNECQKVDIENQLQIILGSLLGIQEQQDAQIEEIKRRLDKDTEQIK